ncbi:MAG: N-acetyltransferase [Syntrophomonadaceae bacterium]|nr:N-acetyltransferase [Syntrophomonadaceae bacterium]
MKGENGVLHIRDAVISDLPSILKIYNYAVKNLAATFDIEEKTLEERLEWFNQHRGKYPLIVAELDGRVVGYCCLSSFRDKAAYSRSAELSIYIDPEHWSQGIGSELMREILRRAKKLEYHTIIAGITADNEASIRLHRKFGFELAGCFKEVGFKFDRWHDVHFYQLVIEAN